jgi:hypothetical protein
MKEIFEHDMTQAIQVIINLIKLTLFLVGGGVAFHIYQTWMDKWMKEEKKKGRAV